MKRKLKIAAVSYTNTLPFIHGLTHYDLFRGFDLEMFAPSKCAEKLKNNEADIALIPIAEINNMPKFEVISDFCLGANGAVKTVLLLSNSPKEKVKKIYLDSHSRTSISLVKILSKFYWAKECQWESVDFDGINDFLKIESVVAIGDKTFKLRSQFQYVYDLSEEWYNFTGLPFVFACWVKNVDNAIGNEVIEQFNRALAYGVQCIPEISNGFNSSNLTATELYQYLHNDMNYVLDRKKKQAMKKYFNYLNQL